MQSKKIDTLAFGSCIFVFFLWTVILNFKYTHFGYHDWDLAFFAQAMWNLAHGSSYVSVFGKDFFANHANLIAYLILPIYKIFPHPLTLLILKVASLVTAAYILYLLAKEKLGAWVGLLFLWLYLIYPPNVFGIIFEFDFESLAPAFLIFLYFFYVKDRWVGFLICALILILTKENLPLIVLAFGIHGLLTKKDKVRWGIIPLLLAGISLYLLNFVFIPLASGRQIGQVHPYYIVHCYQNLWGLDIFHPVKICETLITPSIINWAIEIFNPLIYLPLASPGTLFLISPILAQHLLSSSQTQHSVYFAYILTIAPFVFIAVINALQGLARRPKRMIYYSVLFLIVVTSVVNFSSHFERMALYCKPAQPESLNKERWELVHMIPKDASVVASFYFLAALSQRRDLFAFYKLYSSDYWWFKLPSCVQYALIDFSEPSLVSYLKDADSSLRVKSFFKSGDWVLEKRYGDIVLFKRKSGVQS